MPSGSETTPPSPIHHRFTADLVEIYPSSNNPGLQNLRVFRVLSDVLSDLNIRAGDLIEMTSLDAGQSPEPHAIVAVCFIWSGVLLLRQFVPPKLLITNSSKGNLPHLHIGRSCKVVAQFHKLCE